MNALELVRHDAHAGAGAADEDRAVKAAVRNERGDLRGDLKIRLRGLGIGGAEIFEFISFLGQPGLHGFLGVEAGLITSECDFHMEPPAFTKCESLFSFCIYTFC